MGGVGPVSSDAIWAIAAVPVKRMAHGDANRQSAPLSQAAETILTAHFLKSVCLEMGSVASSVTLLINWLASNHGTKITPLRHAVAAARFEAAT